MWDHALVHKSEPASTRSRFNLPYQPGADPLIVNRQGLVCVDLFDTVPHHPRSGTWSLISMVWYDLPKRNVALLPINEASSDNVVHQLWTSIVTARNTLAGGAASL